MIPKSCAVALAGCLLWMPVARGQDKGGRLTFDVATIRPSQPGLLNGGIKPLPGGDGYMAQNVPVRLMIALMYQVPVRQITGGPDWLDGEHFDIVAKADHSYSKDDLHEMFRNLLADRFNLKLRKEIRQGRVYALKVDKSGVKMSVDERAQDFEIPITYAGDSSVVGRRVSMRYLSWWLGQQLQGDQRPVVDETGLDGNYDFALKFLPLRFGDAEKKSLPAEVADRPTIFDALKEQLGLKLLPEQGPVEYYAVEDIEKPSDN